MGVLLNLTGCYSILLIRHFAAEIIHVMNRIDCQCKKDNYFILGLQFVTVQTTRKYSEWRFVVIYTVYRLSIISAGFWFCWVGNVFQVLVNIYSVQNSFFKFIWDVAITWSLGWIVLTQLRILLILVSSNLFFNTKIHQQAVFWLLLNDTSQCVTAI